MAQWLRIHLPDAGDSGSVSGLGGSPGEGNSNTLQYSCLGNPMDRGAWRATVHGVAESDATEHNIYILIEHLGTGDVILFSSPRCHPAVSVNKVTCHWTECNAYYITNQSPSPVNSCIYTIYFYKLLVI